MRRARYHVLCPLAPIEFLKDPLFLASSDFLKKPERIVALSCVMVLCLLVYRLAEHRVRRQLAATSQTIPNQIHKPTARPTMRWVFKCFEGLDRLTISTPAGTQVLGLRLTALHDQILTLLGPSHPRHLPYHQLTRRTVGGDAAAYALTHATMLRW